jgi:hypothetical protein
VSSVSNLEVVAAAAIALAVVSLALAAFGRRVRRIVIALSVVTGLLAVGALVAIVLDPSHDLLAGAIGASAAFTASLGAIALSAGAERARRIDRELERGRMQLRSLIDDEVRRRVGELDRVLARARADSSSQLAEQERGLAETRQHAIAESEQAVRENLAQMLAEAQRNVEEKITGWRRDLGRSEDALARQVSELIRESQRQIQEMRARIEADGDRIASESEEHRSAIRRLREEMSESVEQALAGNDDELEKFVNERRRAIQEVIERLERREHDLVDRVEREETELQRRIQAGAAEIERHQVEQLQRFTERAAWPRSKPESSRARCEPRARTLPEG